MNARLWPSTGTQCAEWLPAPKAFNGRGRRVTAEFAERKRSLHRGDTEARRIKKSEVLAFRDLLCELGQIFLAISAVKIFKALNRRDRKVITEFAQKPAKD